MSTPKGPKLELVDATEVGNYHSRLLGGGCWHPPAGTHTERESHIFCWVVTRHSFFPMMVVLHEIADSLSGFIFWTFDKAGDRGRSSLTWLFQYLSRGFLECPTVYSQRSGYLSRFLLLFFSMTKRIHKMLDSLNGFYSVTTPCKLDSIRERKRERESIRSRSFRMTTSACHFCWAGARFYVCSYGIPGNVTQLLVIPFFFLLYFGCVFVSSSSWSFRRRLTSHSRRYQQYHPMNSNGRQSRSHGRRWDRHRYKDLEIKSQHRLMV